MKKKRSCAFVFILFLEWIVFSVFFVLMALVASTFFAWLASQFFM